MKVKHVNPGAHEGQTVPVYYKKKKKIVVEIGMIT